MIRTCLYRAAQTFTTLVICGALSHAVFAAEILKPRSNIYIVGEIVTGDAQKFRKVLNAATPPIRVKIFSPGGDLSEAMAIGEMIRESFIQITAPNDWECFNIQHSTAEYPWWPKKEPTTTACTCYSACFVIWSAGIYRFGGKNFHWESFGLPGTPADVRPEQSFIGIHRPRFGAEYFSGLSAREAKVKYDELLLDLVEYLRKMDIPPSITERMSGVASADLYNLSESELESLRGFVPAIEEWIESKCGHLLTQQERYDYESLGSRAKDIAIDEVLGLPISVRPLSTAERHYYDILRKKNVQRRHCTWDAVKDEQISRRASK